MPAALLSFRERYWRKFISLHTKHKGQKGLRLEAAREVRLPLGPVSLALLSSPPFPSFVGPRIVHERDGRRRNLWVPLAVVADERCPCPATQDLVEFDPRSLQLAQPPGRSCYPLVLDGLSTSLCSVAGLPLSSSRGPWFCVPASQRVCLSRSDRRCLCVPLRGKTSTSSPPSLAVSGFGRDGYGSPFASELARRRRRRRRVRRRRRRRRRRRVRAKGS